jgi:hypothetical protein
MAASKWICDVNKNHGKVYIYLLSFGSAVESVMMLDSPNIANELMKTVYSSEATRDL